MMDFLTPITYWHWFTFALFLGILELVLPGVFFLWMGLGAGLVGLLLLALPDLSFNAQLVIFVILSILSVFTGRYLWHKKQPVSDHPQLNERTSQYIGKTYLLIEDSVNKQGRIKIEDTQWAVELDKDLHKGDLIIITQSAGLKLIGKLQD